MTALARPILSKRVSVEVAREPEYGHAPAAYSYFPMTEEAIGAVIEGDTYTRGGANRSMGTVPIRYVPSVTTLPDLATDLDGSAGPWSSLLEAGGFDQVGDSVWELASSYEESVAVRTNIDGMRRTVLGVRGSAEFAGSAARPITFRLTGPTGLTTEDLEFTDPAESDAVLGDPLLLCDAGFTIDVEDRAVITPVLKTFRIAARRSIAERRGSRRVQSVLEVRGVARDPFWEVLIEQNRTTDWEKVLRQELPVSLSMSVSNANGTLAFSTPLGRTAFLASRPQYSSVGGVFCVNLVFGLSGRRNADLQVRRSA